jgi:hypothetical protein
MELILKLKDYPAKFEDYCPELKEKVQFSQDYGSKIKRFPNSIRFVGSIITLIVLDAEY